MIRLLAVGRRMPQWVNAAYQEYIKRLPVDYAVQLIEIEAGKRTKGADIAKVLRQESAAIQQQIQPGSLVIALDVQGQLWDTPTLAKHLQVWHDQQRRPHLLIGGPEGLAADCLQRAEIRWSLSPLTFPHPLVRVILAEQLYRAWSLLAGRKYHRDET